MKKGFTLVELLAVITIIAFIALIAVPQVMKIMKQTKKDIFIENAKIVIKAAEKAMFYNSKQTQGKVEDLKIDTPLTGYWEYNSETKQIEVTVSDQQYTIIEGDLENIEEKIDDNFGFQNLIILANLNPHPSYGSTVLLGDVIEYKVKTPRSASRIEATVEAEIGHKYFASFETDNDLLTSFISGATFGTVGSNKKNKKVTGAIITATTTSGLLRYYSDTENHKVDDIINFSKIIFIDLTDYFGEGEEPNIYWCMENILYGVNVVNKD